MKNSVNHTSTVFILHTFFEKLSCDSFDFADVVTHVKNQMSDTISDPPVILDSQILSMLFFVVVSFEISTQSTSDSFVQVSKHRSDEQQLDLPETVFTFFTI